MHDMGLTTKELGMLDTAFLLPYATLQMFFASLGDRFVRPPSPLPPSPLIISLAILIPHRGLEGCLSILFWVRLYHASP